MVCTFYEDILLGYHCINLIFYAPQIRNIPFQHLKIPTKINKESYPTRRWILKYRGEVFFFGSSPGHIFLQVMPACHWGFLRLGGCKKLPGICSKRCTVYRLGFRGEGHHCISIGATLRNGDPRNFRKSKKDGRTILPWVYQHLHSANLGLNRTWIEDVLKDQYAMAECFNMFSTHSSACHYHVLFFSVALSFKLKVSHSYC